MDLKSQLDYIKCPILFGHFLLTAKQKREISYDIEQIILENICIDDLDIKEVEWYIKELKGMNDQPTTKVHPYHQIYFSYEIYKRLSIKSNMGIKKSMVIQACYYLGITQFVWT